VSDTSAKVKQLDILSPSRVCHSEFLSNAAIHS